MFLILHGILPSFVYLFPKAYHPFANILPNNCLANTSLPVIEMYVITYTAKSFDHFKSWGLQGIAKYASHRHMSKDARETERRLSSFLPLPHFCLFTHSLGVDLPVDFVMPPSNPPYFRLILVDLFRFNNSPSSTSRSLLRGAFF